MSCSKAPAVDTQDLLARFAAFNMLDAADRTRIQNAARPIHAARGELLVQQEDCPRGIHLVLAGRVKCFVLSPSGGEKIVRLADPGSFFGEEAALLNRPHIVNAQAMTQSELLFVPTGLLREAMVSSTPFAVSMSMRLATASYDLMSTMQVQFQLSGTQRVAHYLTRLAPDDAEHCEIRLDIDKQTIAAQLNLTPETLSRILSQLTREGMIQPRGRRGMVLSKLSELRSCAAH
ncbi:Crp/Fnr family transcriptional regulator [Thauera sp.]|jgi:CRP-like cAMP-binding protein|uniref:Crp/Fnr family transcriptional regulator n=1 Tax=Thauera sp. TaxID=1905334 RepID=UPI002A36610E|nr:Crp/Fnr family transcriptional regulator [Thauera sp.]MDX9886696.1 Crp/Fnr family transcriptional regulator [Thauera sp.]